LGQFEINIKIPKISIKINAQKIIILKIK
jgi:hypothetical protein